MIRFTSYILIAIFLSLPLRAEVVQTPSPELKPEQVVEIQLQSLRRNDDPVPDFGIAQTWVFAHPYNKMVTGPLARFSAMIKGMHYHHLINHQRHEVKTVVKTQVKTVFTVSILSSDGLRYAFKWALERAPSGDMAGSWMTTAVSPPLRVEDAI
jgi:hypothetical protein